MDQGPERGRNNKSFGILIGLWLDTDGSVHNWTHKKLHEALPSLTHWVMKGRLAPVAEAPTLASFKGELSSPSILAEAVKWGR